MNKMEEFVMYLKMLLIKSRQAVISNIEEKPIMMK